MAKEKKSMIAILTALEAEAESFILKTRIDTNINWNGYKFIIGNFCGQGCIIASTGIGKVNAAILTTYLIDNYQPRAIFYTGIAGALIDNLKIGDVIIARDCVQWDVNIVSFGFHLGELPDAKSNLDNKNKNATVRFYKTDSKFLIKTSTWNPAGFKVKTGRILTGDSFFCANKRKEMFNLLVDLNGDAVDMEGAACAAAARIQNIPFFLARVISDTVSAKKPEHFKKFLKESSNKMSDLIKYILLDKTA